MARHLCCRSPNLAGCLSMPREARLGQHSTGGPLTSRCCSSSTFTVTPLTTTMPLSLATAPPPAGAALAGAGGVAGGMASPACSK